MLVSAGLNPERVAVTDPDELAVHAGFLRAYDSVRRRIVGLLEAMTREEEHRCASEPGASRVPRSLSSLRLTVGLGWNGLLLGNRSSKFFEDLEKRCWKDLVRVRLFGKPSN